MIRNLRILYLSRPAREKLMVLALLVVMALMWLSNFSHRAGDFLSQSRRTTDELKKQSQWLANRERIERNARDEVAQLDPSQTLDGPRLSAALAGLANEAGLPPNQINATAPEDTQGGQFVIHTVQFNVNRANWATFLPFYYKLQARAPYMSIEALSMAADKANPAIINISLRVSSVEIVQRG